MLVMLVVVTAVIIPAAAAGCGGFFGQILEMSVAADVDQRHSNRGSHRVDRAFLLHVFQRGSESANHAQLQCISSALEVEVVLVSGSFLWGEFGAGGG